MKQDYFIKKNSVFKKILDKGVKLRSNNFTLAFIKANEFRIGITIPTRLGNAVIRNKIKRQIKAILRENKRYLELKVNIILVVKKDFIDLDYQTKKKVLESEFNLLTKKLQIK